MAAPGCRTRVFWTAVALGVTLATGASAVVFTVNSTADEVDDNVGNGFCHAASGNCTLRAAVMEANKSSGVGATIVLPAGTYNFVLPAAGGNGPESGDLNLTTPAIGSPAIVISGAAAATTIIDANQVDRVFAVELNRTASISGVTLREGFTEGSGAGIHNLGTVTVEACTLTQGTAGVSGGAIYNEASGAVTLQRSTLSGNFGEVGGGIDNYGTLDIDQSTISGNDSDFTAGGIFNFGTVFLSNSTISSNFTDGDGGGIYNADTATFWTYNATIVFNHADADADHSGNGGGVFNEFGGHFYPRNSVLAGNLSDLLFSDCFGDVGYFGHDWFGTTLGCNLSPGTDTADWDTVVSLAELGPLQFNGGSTRTHALLSGSTMIDSGFACISLGEPAIDQRDGLRTPEGTCDAGSFENNALPAGLIFANGFELGNLWAWG